MKKGLGTLLYRITLLLLGMSVLTAGLIFYLERRMKPMPQEAAQTMEEVPVIPAGAVELNAPLEFTPIEGSLIGREEDILNILLIGQDRREGEERARSDAMILCTVAGGQKKVILTSFLRDTYAEIPGYVDDRLNAAFLLGGTELLDKTLELNFGVSIDGNFVVDFSGFVAVVDRLGGVEIDLSQEEAAYMEENLSGSFLPGVQRLTGEQALFYARIRSLDSDFGRTGRQRKLLRAMMEGIGELPVTRIPALVDALLPCVSTDLSGAQILWEFSRCYPVVKRSEIVSLQIPAAGTCYDAVIDGAAVLIADRQANYDLLWEEVYGD